MSSFWDENYFFNHYSNDTWGVNVANEQEEVVSGILVDQKIQLSYLNETPTPPVDEPYYLAHQVYPDYGYGYESPYVKQGNLDGYVGYGAENAPVDELYYPTQQSYPGYGYGEDAEDMVDTEDTVDTVMSLVTHHCMMIINHLPLAIRFKYRRYHINICIILILIIIIVKIILLLLVLIFVF
ncbi:hypothetical protein Hanom_Chr09g00811291 [Helianthus anomalus]